MGSGKQIPALRAPRAPKARPARSSGFTLIEVLVSVLIFAVGLLGLAGMQARAVQFSYDAEDRMRASVMADEIVAAMLTANTVSLPGSTVDAWNTRVANAAVSGLQNGVGTVTTDSNGLTTVKITWSSPAHSGTYFTQFMLPPST
ncbi:MAG TPA: type IV pilus modification protein PilV [Burkholderiaceae bacterium]